MSKKSIKVAVKLVKKFVKNIRK